MKFGRRRFLFTAAGGLAGFGFGRASKNLWRRLPRGARRIRRGPGKTRQVATTCTLCPGGCGIRARIVDGHAVKLEGNRLHPVNRGRLCALGQAGLHLLYHPDRIPRPRRRIGGRGSGRFEEITWEDAARIVVEKLAPLVQAGEGQRIVACDGSRGLATAVWARFLAALGSPNLLRDHRQDPMKAACQLTQGRPWRTAHGLDKARCVVSFGAPLLESWWSPVSAQQVYARRASEGGRRRMRLVQFDARYSVTAALADEWHAVRPGGFLALALSLAYVLAKESIYHQDFVTRHATGFFRDPAAGEHERSGFRDFLLRECSPEKLAASTGVTPDVVHRIAKELASDRPTLVLADAAAIGHPDGALTAWAVHCLNAMLGNLDEPGGIVFPEEFPLELPGASASHPGASPSGSGAIQAARVPPGIERLPEMFEGGGPEVPEVLFLHRSNPLYSLPEPVRVARALARVPFLVSFTPFEDETAELADLVLPDCTYLERWDLVPVSTVTGRTVVGVSQPVVAKRLGAMSSVDFLLGVAKQLGGAVEAALPAKRAKDLVRHQLSRLAAERRGTVLTETLEESQLESLEERGWWFPTQEDPAAFRKAAIERGGWWDPVYPHGRLGRVLRGRGGRFQFLAPGIGELVEEHLRTDRSKVAAGGLQLVVYRPLTPSSGVLGHLPVLHDVLGMHLTGRPIFWVEVSQKDARRQDLGNGQAVRVETQHGSLEARVRVVEAGPPGVVAIPHGFGQGGKRSGARVGANALQLLPLSLDSLSGSQGWPMVAVRLVPLEGSESHG